MPGEIRPNPYTCKTDWLKVNITITNSNVPHYYNVLHFTYAPMLPAGLNSIRTFKPHQLRCAAGRLRCNLTQHLAIESSLQLEEVL